MEKLQECKDRFHVTPGQIAAFLENDVEDLSSAKAWQLKQAVEYLVESESESSADETYTASPLSEVRENAESMGFHGNQQLSSIFKSDTVRSRSA